VLAYHTVEAIGNSTSITACLDLRVSHACPDAAALEAAQEAVQEEVQHQSLIKANNYPLFPVEVVGTERLSRGRISPCGSDEHPCNNTWIVKCLVRGASCPSSYPFMLYGNPDAGSGKFPALVECRVQRLGCDLTKAGMTNNGNLEEPNAGAYAIPLIVGESLEGCLITGARLCPSQYKNATYDTNSTSTSKKLLSCGRKAPEYSPGAPRRRRLHLLDMQ
jgi:hypothetical protein